jgi:hypothetical protein
VIKGVVENKTVSVLVLEKVVASRDVIALAPIDLPLTEDWETGLNSE